MGHLSPISGEGIAKSKGKKNVYACPSCGHGFVSQDVDEGVTPFMTECINPRCEGGMAQSFMYNIPQEYLANFKPAVEWYKPPVVLNLTPGEAQHVESGGLLWRLAK